MRRGLLGSRGWFLNGNRIGKSRVPAGFTSALPQLFNVRTRALSRLLNGMSKPLGSKHSVRCDLVPPQAGDLPGENSIRPDLIGTTMSEVAPTFSFLTVLSSRRFS